MPFTAVDQVAGGHARAKALSSLRRRRVAIWGSILRWHPALAVKLDFERWVALGAPSPLKLARLVLARRRAHKRGSAAAPAKTAGGRGKAAGGKRG